MATETKVLTAHIPLELADKVEQIAHQLERSRGWVVKQALTDWIMQQEVYRQLTLEAMADVDADRIVEHQVIEAWAAGLSAPNP